MRSAIGVIAFLLALAIVEPFFHQDYPAYGKNQVGVLLESATTDHVVSHASPTMKLLWLLGGAVAVGIGLWWSQFPKERERQSALARFLGVVLYFLGSSLTGYWVPFSIVHEVEFGRLPTYQAQFTPMFVLMAFGSVLLLGSYFSCFKSKKRILRPNSGNEVGRRPSLEQVEPGRTS